ncbi:MAG TPA: nuclear transport factor 2 family protein [Ohtaekwangia sp.]|uniref:nuclear transport factor 2 family protein n=1 Tax=Ohtaekwangia sp. TaxID=2066019 RepID=UPI002F9562B5
MRTAVELLHAYLKNVQDVRVASELFAADGALELPYLKTLGYTWRAEGPEEIRKFLENVLSLFDDFRFHSTKIFIDLPDQAFGEYEVTTTARGTGKPFHQLYMGRIVVENDKIKLLREALDTVASQQALS